MKIDIRFSRSDVGRVRDVVARMANHSIVVERRRRNVDRRGIDLAHHTIWEKLVGCLLTTRQKSGGGSAVQRFIESKSPLLSLTRCGKAEDIAERAKSELSAFGGIRRTSVIPKQIARNFEWLDAGGWSQIDTWLAPFRKAPQSKDKERVCAASIEKTLVGFGPKQSRNLLQWLGVTQHEIPIDSRIIKWLRELGKDNPLPLLSSVALGESKYYCCIMDAIQQLCTEAGVLPCIFDASIFASFERTWEK